MSEFVSHRFNDISGIQEILECAGKKETYIKVKTLFLSECEETKEKLEVGGKRRKDVHSRIIKERNKNTGRKNTAGMSCA